MIRRCSTILRSIRAICGRSVNSCRQVTHSGGRSHYYNHHHKHGRRWWDMRILMAFTSAAGFSFSEHGIPDKRFEKTSMDDEFELLSESDGWETLVEEEDLVVYRRLVPGPYEIYEYKCVGTYYDVSADLFLDVQNDLEFRSQWDGNVLSLELLKEEDENELIRWVQKYPYPLYPREYVYARRTWVSEDSRTVVVDSEVIPIHLIPGISKNVRVATYRSRMAVRSHNSDFQEHGLDFALTYFDNPEANIPRYVYNWMVNHGGPYFLRQVHEVACEAEQSGRKLNWTLRQVEKIRQRVKRKEAEALLAQPIVLEAPEEENVDEEDLVDAPPLVTKAQKFAFTPVETLPAEAYVTT